jgi:hypothetical protein
MRCQDLGSRPLDPRLCVQDNPPSAHHSPNMTKLTARERNDPAHHLSSTWPGPQSIDAHCGCISAVELLLSSVGRQWPGQIASRRRRKRYGRGRSFI